ncbi:hypothetical protein M885DRAFT_342097 [Pelagophyceae sp. CCMP2097]|nr:hypothetical protein M885DRAFT_342097 [Pelagophyceae sp. CCMP2097]
MPQSPRRIGLKPIRAAAPPETRSPRRAASRGTLRGPPLDGVLGTLPQGCCLQGPCCRHLVSGASSRASCDTLLLTRFGPRGPCLNDLVTGIPTTEFLPRAFLKGNVVSQGNAMASRRSRVTLPQEPCHQDLATAALPRGSSDRVLDTGTSPRGPRRRVLAPGNSTRLRRIQPMEFNPSQENSTQGIQPVSADVWRPLLGRSAVLGGA